MAEQTNVGQPDPQKKPWWVSDRGPGNSYLLNGRTGNSMGQLYDDPRAAQAEADRLNARERQADAAPALHRELSHLVRLLEPLERDGRLNVPGLATLNGARAALAKADGLTP